MAGGALSNRVVVIVGATRHGLSASQACLAAGAKVVMIADRPRS